jgi:dipeptidyl-peptidase 4
MASSMPLRPARLASPALLAIAAVACSGQPDAPPRVPPAEAPSPTRARIATPSTPQPSLASPDFPVEYAATRGYRLGEPRRLTPTEDGRIVLFLRASPQDGRSSLWETDVATGKTRELLRPDAVASGKETVTAEEQARRERQRLRGGGFTFFEASRDGAIIVVGLSGRLYALTRATGQVRELPTGPGVIDPHLSPDGTRVAYVRDNDVYALPLAGGKEAAVTRGGTEARPHGVAEFMAQEEFYRSRGFWWSPDSTEILYQVTDNSSVPQWTYIDPAHPENPPRMIAYPRTGAPHAKVHLAIASVRQPARAAREITWDVSRYPYLTGVTWPKNAPLTLSVRDRLSQQSAVLAIDTKTGSPRVLLTEEDPAWLNLDPSVPRWLPDGSGFFWSTERNGAWELELRDAQGAKKSTVTGAGMGYRNLLAVDADKKIAYVDASNEPVRNEIWAAPFDGSAPQVVSRLTDGTTYTNFGEGSRVYTYFEATMGGAHRFGARSVDGSTTAAIPSDAKPPPFVPRVELAQVGPDSVRVAIVRPRQLDPHRRYPVIDNVYGGPWHNVVSSDAYRYLEQQWLADAVGAIVVLIDARGTAYRDRAWQRAFRDHYGDLPVEGHAEAIAMVAKTYPEIDGERVGIYGWSNGGYLSALAVLRRPDVFKVAVAGAPVADLRDYDAIMEFFLGTPPNPAYDEASLLTWASRPPTADAPVRPLLVIHGTADDNVYLAHTLKFAAAMGLAGRPVELMPLVDQTHMVRAPEASAAVTRRIAEHFRKHLDAGDPAPRCPP